MKRQRLLVLSALFATFAPAMASNALAACTGSNPTWTSSPDRTSVAQCVSNAGPGSTVNVTAGSATWSPSINVNKSITLRGAGIGQTVITGYAEIIDPPIPSAPRVTGFTFNLGSGSYIQIWSSQGFRFDNNRVTRSNHDWALYIGGSNAFSSEGLIDHNEFVNGVIVHFGSASPGSGSRQWLEPLGLGTSTAIYIEDNNFDFQPINGSYPGSLDGNWGSRTVFRFNTSIGGRYEQHSLQGGNQRAVRKWEVYNNSFTNSSFRNYRPFFVRGGTGMLFHNTTDGLYLNNEIDIDNARSSEGSIIGQVGSFGMCAGSSYPDGNTAGQEGWPCRDQIGRSTDASLWSNYAVAGPAQASEPAFFWRNTQPGGEIPVSESCESNDAACTRQNTKHLVESRDYYSYRSSFNGTAGVGEGTLANRPSSCTTGVGYWATDQGEWNSLNPGPDGQLYKCTSTNSWSLYYTPYIYPHPLQTGGAPPPAPPSAPANLRITP